MRNVRTILDGFLEHYGKPPVKEMDAAADRVWRSVSAGEPQRLEETRAVRDSKPIRSVWRVRWPAVATLIAAIALAVLVPARVLRSAPAVFEDGAGSRNVQYGELVRSNGSGTLKFSDGARVEMRAESEVSFERTGEDLRLRVRRGDVIVNATEGSTGQLSVETKDMSAVGKVFLVNAKEEGSRVAVIAGEARVQQGATERKLLPGEHVATSPKMELLSVKAEGGWGPQAEAQMALLQTAIAQKTPEPRLAFEVASIRPHLASNTDGRGGGGGSNVFPGGSCAAITPTMDPRRIAVPDTTLWTLIAWAYPFPNSDIFSSCWYVTTLNLISGGPGWIKSDKWDVEATIPEAARLAVTYRPDFGTSIPVVGPGEASKLQKMILALLEERFKFSVRREMKEVPAYALTLAAGATPKFTVFPWSSSEYGTSIDDPKFKRVWERVPSGRSLAGGATLSGKDVYVADFARLLAEKTGRPIVDRTGFTDPFSFILIFNPPNRNNPSWSELPNVFSAVEKQVGFKLEEMKTTVEVWTIERVEKPSEN